MGNPNPVQATKGSFFRDFVDNSESRFGKSLLTDEGRTAFNKVKSNLKLYLPFRKLPREREQKLMRMAMIQHAVSQILSDIAMEEDGR